MFPIPDHHNVDFFIDRAQFPELSFLLIVVCGGYDGYDETGKEDGEAFDVSRTWILVHSDDEGYDRGND